MHHNEAEMAGVVTGPEGAAWRLWVYLTGVGVGPFT